MYVSPPCFLVIECSRVSQRTQYLNAQNTVAELLNMGVIPIVNENDTLAVSVSPRARIRF